MVRCYLWNTPATIVRDGDEVVESTRAGGRYRVTGSVVPQLRDLSNEQKRSLTDYVVEQQRFGAIAKLHTQNLDEIASRSQPNVSDRAILLLRYLRSSGPLGHVVSFQKPGESGDTLVACEILAATSSLKVNEVLTLAEYCAEQNWVEHSTIGLASSPFATHTLKLKPPGYAHLESAEGYSSRSDQGFIAMWFDESLTDALAQGFEEGIRAAGYKPLRIDGKEHIEKIDDEIIAEIRRSRFVVADFTAEPNLPRGGVYYEAGFARGLGIPVIWTCRKDRIEYVHFDTRQFNHLLWENPADLCNQLSNRISAIIGDGPLKMRS